VIGRIFFLVSVRGSNAVFMVIVFPKKNCKNLCRDTIIKLIAAPNPEHKELTAETVA
jgi:hypothetical protein